MSFQLLDIVLYGFNGERRDLKLRPGELNIITGASKTGKTALIEIVDYCLGSEKCGIYEGIIRKAVEWVGIRLQVEGGQVFVARRLPKKGRNYSEEVYYDLQRTLDLPDYDDLRQTTNLQALEGLLSKHAGIGENIHQPPSGQTRNPLSANIRHALFFSFQQQSEVISNKHLFHKQSEQFVPQAIRDVLPYFLGAVDDTHLAKMIELRQLRRDLRGMERNLSEYEGVRGQGITRARTLLSEAQDVGLYDPNEETDTWEQCVEGLRQAQKHLEQPEEERAREGDAFEKLLQDHAALSEELRIIKGQLAYAKALSSDEQGYSHEAGAHIHRLLSIGLFDSEQDSSSICPLCQSKLSDKTIPAISDLEQSIKRLERQVRIVEERSPQMERLILKLQERIQDVKRRLRENRESQEAVQTSNQRLQMIRDHAARRAYIIGRIGLYLESLPYLDDTSELKLEIEEAKLKIAQIEEELSDEVIQEKIDSIISILSCDMSKWAQSLGLEHSSYPIRLDIKQLTVKADSENGPIPLERMGSGENWVWYHLITHFVLHKWFVRKNRPVPRFIFIDQPSQVYFPPDSDLSGTMENIKNEDRLAVAKMYRLALDVAVQLQPHFQIIMTDHANLADEWFQRCVIEKWWGDRKLVPNEWTLI